jgi:hypothetical protein
MPSAEFAAAPSASSRPLSIAYRTRAALLVGLCFAAVLSKINRF